MNEDLEKNKNSIKSFLNYRGQRNIAILKAFQNYKGWKTDADREIAQRNSLSPDFMFTLSMKELVAIANGDVKLAQLAAEVDNSFGDEE